MSTPSSPRGPLSAEHISGSRRGENLFDAPNGRSGVGIPSTQGNELIVNDNGSVDIYVQPTAPTAGPDSKAGHNWFPSPPGTANPSGFLLLLRMYMPQQALFDKEWTPSSVVKAACQ